MNPPDGKGVDRKAPGDSAQQTDVGRRTIAKITDAVRDRELTNDELDAVAAGADDDGFGRARGAGDGT